MPDLLFESAHGVNYSIIMDLSYDSSASNALWNDTDIIWSAPRWLFGVTYFYTVFGLLRIYGQRDRFLAYILK